VATCKYCGKWSDLFDNEDFDCAQAAKEGALKSFTNMTNVDLQITTPGPLIPAPHCALGATLRPEPTSGTVCDVILLSIRGWIPHRSNSETAPTKKRAKHYFGEPQQANFHSHCFASGELNFSTVRLVPLMISMESTAGGGTAFFTCRTTAGVVLSGAMF